MSPQTLETGNLNVVEMLGEEPSITDLVRKTHMKVDGTFSDKRAKMIVDEVESIVVSQQVNNPYHDEVTLITPLMRDEAFYSIVKPNKGKLSGLGSAQMESYDPTDPPFVVLPRQARYEQDLISLTGVVKLMSQQLSALCEARGVIVPPEPEQPPHPSQSPTEAATTHAPTYPSSSR